MYTNGFDNSIALTKHFGDHGLEFSATDGQQYLMLADHFCGVSPVPPGVRECVRRSGDVVRYNPSTEEFAVLSASRFIRTYFKPDPARHGAGTNLQYFIENCAR